MSVPHSASLSLVNLIPYSCSLLTRSSLQHPQSSSTCRAALSASPGLYAGALPLLPPPHGRRSRRRFSCIDGRCDGAAHTAASDARGRRGGAGGAIAARPRTPRSTADVLLPLAVALTHTRRSSSRDSEQRSCNLQAVHRAGSVTVACEKASRASRAARAERVERVERSEARL